MTTLRARLDDVRERIARAARRAGRDPASIRLVAVSKTFSIEDIRAAAELGQREFGENKVQEALPKISATADLPLRWHLVGHLQSNKARKAAGAFDVVHSADSADLIGKIDDAAAALGRAVEILVQVDLAREPTKHGTRAADVRSILDQCARWQSARVRGLMLLPPAVDEPKEARPYFMALRRLRDDLLTDGVAPEVLAELSMGMSHDFEVAVEEGATLVRVGSAIFGARTIVRSGPVGKAANGR
jgi:pyridoxal phosphate enzyme (YggS family)